MMEIGGEWGPLAEQVIAGFSQRRLGQDARPRPPGEALQAGHRPRQSVGFSPLLGPLGRCQLLLVPGSLPQIRPRQGGTRDDAYDIWMGLQVYRPRVIIGAIADRGRKKAGGGSASGLECVGSDRRA